MTTAETQGPVGQPSDRKPAQIDPRVAVGLQRVALEIRKRYEAGADIGAAISPSEGWIEKNSAALAAGEAPEVPDEDLVVSFVLVGSLAFPSALLPRQEWRQGATSLTPLFRMPLTDFKTRIEAQLAFGAAAARAAGGG